MPCCSSTAARTNSKSLHILFKTNLKTHGTFSRPIQSPHPSWSATTLSFIKLDRQMVKWYLSAEADELIHRHVFSEWFVFWALLVLVKHTYLNPGNSPLTFWNSLLKTDHLPCRIVSAKGERSHGEECASAAATWCVWQKPKLLQDELGWWGLQCLRLCTV